MALFTYWTTGNVLAYVIQTSNQGTPSHINIRDSSNLYIHETYNILPEEFVHFTYVSNLFNRTFSHSTKQLSIDEGIVQDNK